MTAAADRPADFDQLCEKLASGQGKMPKRLEQTAAYMVAHPDAVAFGTTASIAAAAGVQPSTLIRFAQAIGFEGFSDLQTLFKDRLLDRNLSYDSRLAALHDHDSSAPGGTVLAGFIAAGRESLARLEEEFSSETFDQATDILARAGTIYLYARRRAFPPLIQLRYAFAKLGIRSEICGSINAIDEDILSFAGPQDAFLVISFAPYSKPTVQAAEQARAQQTPIVAISDSPLSPLAPLATAMLRLNEADFGGFRTLAASMTLAMALSVVVADKRRALQGLAKAEG